MRKDREIKPKGQISRERLPLKGYSLSEIWLIIVALNSA
jgi:hypothetical protein